MLSMPPPSLTALCPPNSIGVPAACVLLAPSGVAERRYSSGVRLNAGVPASPGVRAGEAGSWPPASWRGSPKENSAEGELGWGASSLAALGSSRASADARAASAKHERGAESVHQPATLEVSADHVQHNTAAHLPAPWQQRQRLSRRRRRRPPCRAACCVAQGSTAACAASRCSPRAPA